MILTSSVRSEGKLVDLPNISFVLAEQLKRIGIPSPKVLKEIGAKGAWSRLRATGIDHGMHVLFALEGAIQGISWKNLPTARRQELLHC